MSDLGWVPVGCRSSHSPHSVRLLSTVPGCIRPSLAGLHPGLCRHRSLGVLGLHSKTRPGLPSQGEKWAAPPDITLSAFLHPRADQLRPRALSSALLPTLNALCTYNYLPLSQRLMR